MEHSSIPATAGIQAPEGASTQLHKTVRVTLMFTDPNAFAFFLTISVLFTFIRYYWARSIFQKLFFGAAIIVIMLTLAATFSRKSWLAIFPALGIVGLRFPRVLVEGALAAVGGVLVLFVSDTANFSEALWQRFMTLFIDPNVSISERVVAWEVGMQLFHRSPLICNGVGSFWTLSWLTGIAAPLPAQLLRVPAGRGLACRPQPGLHHSPYLQLGQWGSARSGSPNRTRISF